MDTYISITDQIRSIKTIVRNMILGGIIIQIIFLGIYFKIIYPKKEIVEKDVIKLKNLSIIEICELGFLSISNKEPNNLLITDDLIQLIQKSNLKNAVKEVILVKKIALNQCLIKVESVDSIKNFELTLQRHPFFPFEYKIIDIQEIRNRDNNEN